MLKSAKYVLQENITNMYRTLAISKYELLADIKDSKLVLVAKKEDYEGKNYTSCLVNTRDKYTFKYGRIEICAKLPKGRGTWPALWFVGHPEEKEKKWGNKPLRVNITPTVAKKIDIFEQLDANWAVFSQYVWRNI